MRKADKNEDDKMTLKEVKHFLRQINVEVDDVYAEEIFKVSPKDNKDDNGSFILSILLQKCDTSNSKSLEGPEIKQFYDLLTQREEIDVIYNKYSGPGGEMSSTDLLNFLLNEQREEVTLPDAVRLIEKYEVDPTGELGFATGSSAGFNWASRACFCRFFFSSKAEASHDQRWLPDVPAPGRGLRPQPGS